MHAMEGWESSSRVAQSWRALPRSAVLRVRSGQPRLWWPVIQAELEPQLASANVFFALSSFRTSGVLLCLRLGEPRSSGGFLLRWDKLDTRARTVLVGEDLVSHTTYIRLVDGIDLIELAEQLSPIGETGLILGELTSETFGVGKAAKQIGASAGFEALKFFVGDVFVPQPVKIFMNRGAHLVGRVAGEGDGVKGKEARKFVSRKAAEALGLGSDALIAHEGAIEPRGAAVRKDVSDGVVDRVVGVSIVGAMIALDVERLRSFADGDEFFGNLRRLNRGHWLRLGAGGGLREVTCEDGHRLSGLHVTDNSNDDVRGHVELLVEVSRFGRGDLADLALPANAWPPVGVRDVSGCEELLDHTANGRRVDAHAAFFLNHVPFLIELTLDGLADALALQVGPELETIRRHAPEVLCGIFGGRCVDADCAVLLGDRRKFIRNHILLRFSFGVLKDFEQLCEFLLALADSFAVLSVVGRIGNFDRGEGNLFGGVIRGADLGAPLEGHVFEHVGETACALRIVGRARVDERIGAEDRSLRALADNQRQAIRQDFDGGPFLEARQILRLCRPTKSNRTESDCRNATFYSHQSCPPQDISVKNPTIPKRKATL